MSAAFDKPDVDLQFGMQRRGSEILPDFDRLRLEDLVHLSEQSHCWVLTRHQDVSASSWPGSRFAMAVADTALQLSTRSGRGPYLITQIAAHA